MNRDEIKDYIKSYIPCTAYLDKARKGGYCCPICGSGTHGSGSTGAVKYYPETNTWTCHACDGGHDVIDAYMYRNGCDYSTAITSLMASVGLTEDNYQERAQAYKRIRPAQTPDDAEEQLTSFTDYFRKCNERLNETDYYTRRGISQETAQRFMLGYDPAWKHPKAPSFAPASPRLIIPVSEYSYIARDTRTDIPDAEEEYKKSKCKGRERPLWTFNHKAIGTSNRPLFITEGEIDALSVIEAGGQAVGLGSISNVERFISLLASRPITQPFIVCLDNEDKEQVRQAVEKLTQGIEQAGGTCIVRNICGQYKDPNDALIANREEFTKMLRQAEEDAVGAIERKNCGDPEQTDHTESSHSSLSDDAEGNIDLEEYRQTSALYDLYNFLNGIDPRADTTAVPTGFKTLDDVLEGGLYEGLIVVGGISSLGKTTLCMQIADQIAQQGRDVLIFSLEMDNTELMAKSISRETLLVSKSKGKGSTLAKTNRGITAGHRYKTYSKAEIDVIDEAQDRYSDYAEHIYIHVGVGDLGHRQIREAVHRHTTLTGTAPVVLVDYLQIMAKPDMHCTDKQAVDINTLELKRISRDFKTPVIAVSSVNRSNYLTPIDFESFKESGAVEYSSDLVLGLQLKCLEEDLFDGNAQSKLKAKRDRIKKAKAENPREIQLVILKNRNGKTGDTVNFRYYPQFNLFEEGALLPFEKEGWKPKGEKRTKM